MRTLLLIASFGLALLVVAQTEARAQDAKSVILIQGGRVCAGGTDVMWGLDDGKIMRWHREDEVVSEIKVPDLGDHVVGGRFVAGCWVRPDGEVELYYEEAHANPGAVPPYTGADVLVRTIWMAAGRHRVVLDRYIPEGDRAEQIRIFPVLGVGLRDDLTLERFSDALRYKVEIPEGSYLLGAWQASRSWPVDPPELVVCYAYPQEKVKEGGCVVVRIGSAAMQQRPVTVGNGVINRMNLGTWGYMSWTEAQNFCALKGPASKGYNWPSEATFDCRRDPDGGNYAARYSVDNGYVVWVDEWAAPNRKCRQRSLGDQQLVVEAQCFLLEGTALLASLPNTLQNGNFGDGYEYPSTNGWRLTIFHSDTDRPIIGRLLPTRD